MSLPDRSLFDPLRTSKTQRVRKLASRTRRFPPVLDLAHPVTRLLPLAKTKPLTKIFFESTTIQPHRVHKRKHDEETTSKPPDQVAAEIHCSSPPLFRLSKNMTLATTTTDHRNSRDSSEYNRRSFSSFDSISGQFSLTSTERHLQDDLPSG